MFTPEQELIRAFWKCLKDDISGRGCTLDNLSPEQKLLPYSERVILEREQLQAEATSFLTTDDFSYWSGLSHLNPDKLRGRFHAIVN